ncbi:MAG: hypothetical protein WCT18_04510 [Patescibacteria group bacterium]
MIGLNAAWREFQFEFVDFVVDKIDDISWEIDEFLDDPRNQLEDLLYMAKGFPSELLDISAEVIFNSLVKTGLVKKFPNPLFTKHCFSYTDTLNHFAVSKILLMINGAIDAVDQNGRIDLSKWSESSRTKLFLLLRKFLPQVCVSQEMVETFNPSGAYSCGGHKVTKEEITFFQNPQFVEGWSQQLKILGSSLPGGKWREHGVFFVANDQVHVLLPLFYYDDCYFPEQVGNGEWSHFSFPTTVAIRLMNSQLNDRRIGIRALFSILEKGLSRG